MLRIPVRVGVKNRFARIVADLPAATAALMRVVSARQRLPLGQSGLLGLSYV